MKISVGVKKLFVFWCLCLVSVRFWSGFVLGWW